MITSRGFSLASCSRGLIVLVMALGLAACNGGGGGGGGGGGQPADGGGLVLDGPAGNAIAVPADPAQIVAINPQLDLSNTVFYDSATGEVSVTFTLTDEDGNGISLYENPLELRMYVAELIQDPTGDENPGPAWNQLLQERGDTGKDTPEEDALPGTLTVINGETGEYRYDFDETVMPTTLGNVMRVTVRARYRLTINGERYYVVLPVNASYDWDSAESSEIELASSGADMVTTEACEACHGDRIGDVGHGGGYTQVKSCNLCHNVNYMADRSLEADLSHMIHRIHAAQVFDELTDDGEPVDFSHLTYPQHTFTCATCHGGAPDAELATTNVTELACTGCHTDVNLETGENHGGDPGDAGSGGAHPDDGSCTACHTPGNNFAGASTTHPYSAMHNPLGVLEEDLNNAEIRDPRNVPEFDVAVTVSDPANGSFFTEGEMPVVNIQVTPTDGGPAVDFSLAEDDDFMRDGRLHAAIIGVYPRFESRPVLTPGSCTDGGNAQRPSIFGGDPGVNPVGANEMNYNLLALPALGTALDGACGSATFDPGTYIVRVEVEDYGANTSEDYVTASSGMATFQVGTAEVTPKISGDACVDCHGDTRMHLTGRHPHNAAFDVDECLMCHDQSENYGEYIGNRVHAVHAASVTGDAHDRDWSHVTFPQDPNNCTICHTDPEADPPVWEVIVPQACAGCHGGDVTSNVTNVSGDGTEGEAAAHIIQNMGLNPAVQTTVPDTDFGTSYGCAACHGPNTSFQDGELSLFNVHGLRGFGVPAPDDDT